MGRKKVVIYARTACDGPETELNSISNQINKCLDYAKENNLDVVKV